jgi:hypothetical protein
MQEGGCSSIATTTVGVRYVGGVRNAGSGKGGVWVHDVGERETTLPPEEQTASSTFVTTTGALRAGAQELERCTAAFELAHDPTLKIDGVANEAVDGIYGDSVKHPEVVTLTVDSSMTHGFAVMLDLAGAMHAAVTKNNVAEPFTPQQVGDSVLFWFDAPLLASETLTIAPEK